MQERAIPSCTLGKIGYVPPLKRFGKMMNREYPAAFRAIGTFTVHNFSEISRNAFVGLWRSLVARPSGGRKVAGSSPASPTKQHYARALGMRAFVIEKGLTA